MIVETSVVLTIVGGVAVLLRIALVSRGNLNLAFVIAHVSNFAEILLSTLLLVVPVLSLVALFIIETWAFPIVHEWLRRPRLDRLGEALAALTLNSGAVVVAVVFQTEEQLVIVGAIAYAYLLLVWRSVRDRLERLLTWFRKNAPRRERGAIGSIHEIGLTSIAVGTLILAVLGCWALVASLMPSDAAWSASEVITFRDQEPYVGRVLSDEGRWTYILIDDPRELRIVASSDVASRTVCDYGTVQELEDRLWFANLFATVALRPTSCEVGIEQAVETWEAH